ncbi:MAG: hypothetical protein K2V38_17845, partial [Gemmataceae bacterium]|nr:hypothetical protein [Gemmataceae bacterium]
FDVTVPDGAAPGAAALNLMEKGESNGTATWTGLDGPSGRLILSPAPTDADTDPGDAVFIVLGKGVGVAFGASGDISPTRP